MKFAAALFSLFLIYSLAAFSQTSGSYIQTHAQSFTGLEVPLELIASLSNKKLILIGEAHGTNEMPEYTFKIIQQLSRNGELALGLEFPISTQDAIDAYLKSGDEKILASLDFFKDSSYHSGRGSKAMIEFLKNVRSLPAIKVFCFDIPDNSSNPARDTLMAENILKYMKSNPHRMVLTYSGNIHSRLTEGFPDNPTHKNMGSELLSLSHGALNLQNTTNILYRANEGSDWFCSREKDNSITCGLKNFGPINSTYASSIPSARYYLKEPTITDGHAHTIFLRKITGSLPQF
jgi:uncharacterized iron-regulated protein